MTYVSTILATTGLSHYWVADETSGTTLTDTGGSNNGTYVGTAGPGAGVSLASGSSQSFRANGSASAAQLPNDIIPWDSGDFSVEFLFKTSSASTALFSQSGQVTLGGSVNGFGTASFYTDSTGKLRASMFWDATATDQVVSAGAVNDSVVHQVVGTYNAATDVLTIYLDGSSIGTLTSYGQFGYSGAYGYYLGALQAVGGAWPDMADGWHYGTADLGHVSTYNALVLPSGDVTAHWAAVPAAAAPTSTLFAMQSNLRLG